MIASFLRKLHARMAGSVVNAFELIMLVGQARTDKPLDILGHKLSNRQQVVAIKLVFSQPPRDQVVWVELRQVRMKPESPAGPIYF